MNWTRTLKTVAPQIAIFIAIFLVSAVSLALELLVVRVLSYLYWANFVYLTIPVTLLGLGIGSVWVGIRTRRCPIPDRVTANLFLLFAVSIPTCLWIVSRAPPLIESYSLTHQLVAIQLILAIPFLLCGGVIGALFCTHHKQAPSIYGAELVAGGFGVLLFIFFLRPLGANGLTLLLTALAAIGYATFSISHGGSLRRTVGLACLPLSFVLLNGSDFLGNVPNSTKPPTAPGLRDGRWRRLVYTEWTPTARVDLLDNPVSELSTSKKAGSSTALNALGVIVHDGTAWTPWISKKYYEWLKTERSGPKPASTRSLLYLMANPSDVLVIGVGGGIDVFSALAWDAKSVTGVEINPATFDLFKQHLPTVASSLEQKRVRLHLGDGRLFLKRTDDQYDAIMLGGVDTYAAHGFGSAFTENSLYTVEAMEDLLSHLRPNGILAISRATPKLQQDARLVSIYLEAAKRMNIQTPAENVFVVMAPTLSRLYGTKYVSTLFFKKAPFLPSEITTALHRLYPLQEKRFVAYLPPQSERTEQKNGSGTPEDDPHLTETRAGLAALLSFETSQLRNHLLNESPINISPTTDDKPYFFNFEKVQSLWETSAASGLAVSMRQLLSLAATLASVMAVSIFIPLLVGGRNIAFSRQTLAMCGLSFLLGGAFMFAEIGFIQRMSPFVGGPVYSMALVLGGLLVSSGLGALLSANRTLSLRRALVRCSLTLVIWPLVSQAVLLVTLRWPEPARILSCLLLIIPMGVQMGGPFAVVLRKMYQPDGRLLPWMWGLNSLGCVVASFASLFLLPTLGITAVIQISSALYLFCLVVTRRLLRTAR